MWRSKKWKRPLAQLQRISVLSANYEYVTHLFSRSQRTAGSTGRTAASKELVSGRNGPSVSALNLPIFRIQTSAAMQKFNKEGSILPFAALCTKGDFPSQASEQMRRATRPAVFLHLTQGIWTSQTP